MGFGKYDIGVIGGGIIGLATAMRLTQEYPAHRVVVLEKEPEVGRHQTGHNSGVIHAGIYYAPGSKKANFCSLGATLLRRFCDERGIEHESCGKVIVATEESQLPALDELLRRGTANGAEGLERVGAERLRELEPHAGGIGAIHSPRTGIVDYSKVTAEMANATRENGGDVFTETELLGVASDEGGLTLETSRGEIRVSRVINCAGLQADMVAHKMGLEPGIRIIPFRGEFFTLQPDRARMVNGLIYPVPDPRLPFLGVHLTRRVDGGVEAGPNAVLAFAREGYRKTDFDAAEMLRLLTYPGFWGMSARYWKSGLKEMYRSNSRRSFTRSLQVLMPELQQGDLSTPGTGVRAQAVSARGELLQDFAILRTQSSIHVLNAPSPGATASLAIGRHIVDEAAESFGLAA
jgi:L-2-hydroxyglutarate oxidase LhgO